MLDDVRSSIKEEISYERELGLDVGISGRGVRVCICVCVHVHIYSISESIGAETSIYDRICPRVQICFPRSANLLMRWNPLEYSFLHFHCLGSLWKLHLLPVHHLTACVFLCVSCSTRAETAAKTRWESKKSTWIKGKERQEEWVPWSSGVKGSGYGDWTGT